MIPFIWNFGKRKTIGTDECFSGIWGAGEVDYKGTAWGMILGSRTALHLNCSGGYTTLGIS